MGRTRSNYEPGSVIFFSFKSNLLNNQHISLDWKTNPKINIGSVKSLAWACSKVWSYPGWVVRLDFRRKLRRSSEYYSRTKSNHGSNRVESWVKQGRIISRTGSYHWSSRVELRVKHCRIMGRTSSYYESNRVICFNFTSILLNVQHILLDWNTNTKINFGSVKSLAWVCSKVRSYPGWGVRCNFRRKLRRSKEHYCRTKSNQVTNSVESLVEQGR